MRVEAFDPVKTELKKSISLIEASAGTGKTYAIAMLVLRLVVELDIAINKVLVVTFTKAATEELKDRIRTRLVDAKRALADHIDGADKAINDWLAQINLPPETIKQRLDIALLDIDQAGIFTIHGFCQRMLREHALSSGQLFDAELTEDLAAIKQACADDFWRREIQSRPAWEVAVFTKDFKTPDLLLNSIGFVAADAVIYPNKQNLDDVLYDLRQCADKAKLSLMDYAQSIQAWFEGPQFKSNYQASFMENYARLSEWLLGHSAQFPNPESLVLFTYNGLLDALNGNQFRTNKNQASDERKAEFITSLNIDTTPFDNLAKIAQNVTIMLRRNLLDTLDEELDKHLEQINVWSFDNLITHLAKALQGDQAVNLINELRQRFDAALIDEFQDTDNNQWHIFSSLFAVQSHYLLLVGDPKQAIYKFRGADIYSYLTAQQQAQHRYTLGNNWRSQPLLVAAVNGLFKRQHAFLLPNLTFYPTEPALSEADGTLHYKDKAVAPMVIWQLPESDSKTGYWQPNRNDAAQAICINVANEIVKLLCGDFSLQPQNKKLQPQDIAILVRSNKQAREYQEVLRQAGVPSVLNSTESVFASDEAVHLYVLLEAAAHPSDQNLLGQALALSWFGYDGQALCRIINNEADIDTIMTRFMGYYQTWQQVGVMTMMQMLLRQEKIASVLLKSQLAERRLSNLQHVLELLQQAVIDERLGIHKTLSWLKAAITKANEGRSSPENQQLRLESDADAVKIITMHRSKGLEFPVVFCPYLWQGKPGASEKHPFIKCHLPDPEDNNKKCLIVDLGSVELDKHIAQAEFEEQAEDLRLAYVAVTRAKYRCYIVWANVRSEAVANASALAYLLDFAEEDFLTQQANLQSLHQQNEEAFAYRLLGLDDTVTGYYQSVQQQAQLAAKTRDRSLYTNWQMSSYTALSALSVSETPELPEDKAREDQVVLDQEQTLLPAGAHTGNVIHELLENVAFADLANKINLSALRDKACQRYGLRLEQPEVIDNLLCKLVNTPLSITDAKFCLMNLPDNQCVKEMPFYLTLPAFNTYQINDILRDQPAFQPLTSKQMSGFLTGFIDLICIYDKRYYVMDYKTNRLSSYHIDALTQAMREHNYGLQYWLYCVVLHKYLQNRLFNYNYAEHFGGVRYLFVRGMEPENPMSGVFADNPDLPTLEALSALFKVQT